MDNVTKIALAITTIALVSVVLVNGTQAASLVKVGTAGFGNSILDAEKG